jgi:hypothetical protein
MAEIRHFRHLARLVLIERHRGFLQGSRKMPRLEKIETLAFMVGLCMTGFLTFVALPLA